VKELKNSIYLILLVFVLSAYGCATTSDLKAVSSDLNQKMEEKLAAMDAELATMKKTVTSLDTMRKGQANTAADITDLRDNLQQLRGQIETLKNDLTISTKKQEQVFDDILLKVNFIENFLEIGKKDIGGDTSKSTGNGVSKGQGNIQDKDKAYSAAYQIFKNGNYSKARTEFQTFLTTYPSTEHSDNAQFWIGECYFFEKKYEQAILEYEKVVKNYPSGSKVPYALLKQGLSFLNLGDKTSARLLLQQVIKDYPNTNQARIARAKLQEIK
jgi:tol-pal system protein YbgF